jgi:Ca-activated chloride channel family protein
MSFATPAWLWALLALPLLALAEAWALRRDRERTARLVARPLWPRVLEQPGRFWRPLRITLITLGAGGLVLALARPQWGVVREKVEREGVDLVLILDTSGSMATEDVPGSRLFLAKTALQSLVQRLPGDRFALLAFEGEAYPLVPLTLDTDAIGLFLDTLDPGAVSSPGTSLGEGLVKGLSLFADQDRRNKAMILVSDGEDLEGEVEAAVAQAKQLGVVVHTVGVGTEQGEPVPDFDREGKQIGFKKDESGAPVISRLHPETLEAIARGTGGRFFRLNPADTSLGTLAAAIEGMEQKALAREFSYRKKERYQIPLGVSLVALALALLLPLPARRRATLARAAGLVFLLLALAPPAGAAEGKAVDEVLLRPKRLTAAGQKEYAQGNHPQALRAFEKAAGARPDDIRTRFNLADGLYKNGKYEQAEPLYRALAGDPRSPLAGPARYNLGNTLYQKQDFKGAIGAYREALHLDPEDMDTKRNLELALRALERQEEQKRRQQQQKPDRQNQDRKPDDKQGDQKDQQKGKRPQTREEKENERFEKEAGMPKERAMQLLDALQQNEKGQQKKARAAKAPPPTRVKDW